MKSPGHCPGEAERVRQREPVARRGRALSDELDLAPPMSPVALLNGTSGTPDLAFDLAAIARRLACSAPSPIKAPAPTPGQYWPLHLRTMDHLAPPG